MSLIVGILGFILLLTGVALGLAGLVSVGVVTGLGGALTEGAATLVFKQANKAKSDAQENLAAIADAAERDEGRQMALIYAARISDAGLRDSTNADLARQSIAAVSALRQVSTSSPEIGQ